jgi:hypothetical protein
VYEGYYPAISFLLKGGDEGFPCLVKAVSAQGGRQKEEKEYEPKDEAQKTVYGVNYTWFHAVILTHNIPGYNMV